jgi:hypothetical protein
MPRPVVAAVALAIVLSGCVAQTSGSFDDPPEGLSISVYQPRPDIPKNRIAIEVHNDGDEPVTITDATLSTAFFGDFVWGPGRTATVAPGYAVDLRVDIPDAVCTPGLVEANGVTFSWNAGDRSGISAVEPGDEFHVLDRLHDEACLAVNAETVAVLTAASLTAPAQQPAPAELLITVEPTGLPGTLTVDTISSTTLLMPAGADGIGVSQLDLGIAVDADGPAAIRVPIVPNRCDPHALAEDKIGTRMPLYVTLPDGTEGRLVLAASDELRGQMYAFFSSYCGL